MQISAHYTDTPENLLFFATSKGWKPRIEVEEEYEEVHADKTVWKYTRRVEVDNPVTLEQFLSQWANDYLLEGISQPILAEVERRASEWIEQQKEQYLQILASNLSVTTE